MNQPVIQIQNLVHSFGKKNAVNGLNLAVERGRCYGFFGRNGAGKTTTIKCLLNLLRPTSGTISVFGMDPSESEVAIKSRLAYVPDEIGVYPWMTVSSYLEYLESFRSCWNLKLQADLLDQFGLSPGQKAQTLSKGQRVQMALIGALCPEPELLVLDEPTSGLDPLIRREFIRTVIGAYLDADPEYRSVFVSTHLITEFEGLIDEFAIIEQGRSILQLHAEESRRRFRRIRARFPDTPPSLDHPFILSCEREGRELEISLNGDEDSVVELLQSHHPEEISTSSLTLEEVFLATVAHERKVQHDCQPA